jgi:hypothetical protein
LRQKRKFAAAGGTSEKCQQATFTQRADAIVTFARAGCRRRAPIGGSHLFFLLSEHETIALLID